MNRLASGWSTATVGEVMDLINGAAFKPTDWSSEGLPIIRIQNLNNPKAPFNYFSGELAPKFRVRKGDLLFAWSGTPGTSFGAHIWAGDDAWLNQHIFRVEFDRSKLDSRYLRLAINQNLNEYISQAHGGAGLAHITKGRFENSEIIVPPLNEQHRIVAKLDALFERSGNIRDKLDQIPALLDRLRKSILASAFRGELTREWRAARNERTWATEPLGDLIEGKPKNGYSANPVERETAWRVLTLSATTSGRFRPECYKYFDERISADSPFWLKHGDILIQRGNTIEYVGVPAIYNRQDDQYIYPDLMMRVRPSERVRTEFLWLMLSAEPSRQFMRERATGTAGNMPKINQQTLMSVPIPIPTITEQDEIVRIAMPALALLDTLRERVDELQNRVRRTNQSLLTKAFRGELVPQDVNDEPASMLLERIRAERAAKTEKPTQRRKGS